VALRARSGRRTRCPSLQKHNQHLQVTNQTRALKRHLPRAAARARWARAAEHTPRCRLTPGVQVSRARAIAKQRRAVCRERVLSRTAAGAPAMLGGSKSYYNLRQVPAAARPASGVRFRSNAGVSRPYRAPPPRRDLDRPKKERSPSKGSRKLPALARADVSDRARRSVRRPARKLADPAVVDTSVPLLAYRLDAEWAGECRRAAQCAHTHIRRTDTRGHAHARS
jgi:hypothetical protein